MFADRAPMNLDSSNSYDNKIILMSINWAKKDIINQLLLIVLNRFLSKIVVIKP